MTATSPSTSADTPAQVRATLVERAEERLHNLLTSEHAYWKRIDHRAAVPVEAVTSVVGSGGKRLRPAFCLTGYLAAGGAPDDPVAVDAAAALEMLHTFGLIHDDVLDDSPLRRGVPTVHARHEAEHRDRAWQGEHRRFGEGVAALAGDLAHVYADRLAAPLSSQAREIWLQLRAEVLIGQYLDIAMAAEFVADPELSRWVAVCKSGWYSIHRPLQLGAAAAGRTDLVSAFDAYGEALGEAFQLRDDLIDAFGDSAVTGKPTGLDLGGHKMTLLLALAIRRDPALSELATSGTDGAPAGDPTALLDALRELGVREEVEQRIDLLVERARAALETAPIPREWRDELAHMAVQVAYRQS